MQRKYKAILFDVSDTQVEYSPSYAQIYGDRLCSLGFEVSKEKANEISKTVNWTIGEQNHREQYGAPHLSEEELNVLLDEAALSCVTADSDRISQHLEQLKTIQIPKQKLSIISDVTRVLNNLTCKYRMAIVSNHYAWLMEYLKTSGLFSYFESIVISDMVGVAKPDSRIMQIAFEELSLEAKDCIYIGDQPMDVLCAKQIGMDCVWIAPKDYVLPEFIPYREDYRIASISDLLNIL